MELYGFMEREKKIPSYFFIITKQSTLRKILGQGNQTREQAACKRDRVT